jgi:hypothetical protein
MRVAVICGSDWIAICVARMVRQGKTAEAVAIYRKLLAPEQIGSRPQ